jgi:hypothetical protein
MRLRRALIAPAIAAVLVLSFFAYLGHQENSSIAKNESSAYLFLRAVYEDNRKLKIETGAYASSLEHLDSSSRPEFKRVESAYEFKYRAGPDSFRINADPKQYGKTGVRSFYVDQTGTVRYDTGKSAGASSVPLSSRSPCVTTH